MEIMDTNEVRGKGTWEAEASVGWVTQPRNYLKGLYLRLTYHLAPVQYFLEREIDDQFPKNVKQDGFEPRESTKLMARVAVELPKLTYLPG